MRQIVHVAGALVTLPGLTFRSEAWALTSFTRNAAATVVVGNGVGELDEDQADRVLSDTDPRDPVYHHNSECPYGQEIIANGNGHPGTGDRRRCDWCVAHTNTGRPDAATEKAPS